MPLRTQMLPIFCLCLPSPYKNDCSSSKSRRQAQPGIMKMNLFRPMSAFLRRLKTSSKTSLCFPLVRVEPHTHGLIARKAGEKEGRAFTWARPGHVWDPVALLIPLPVSPASELGLTLTLLSGSPSLYPLPLKGFSVCTNLSRQLLCSWV